MTLLALYVGCLALGGILIGASLLGGGQDGDGPDGDASHGLDHEVDADGMDHDHELHHDHAADGLDHAHDHGHALDAHNAGGFVHAVGATLLSFRFWTFALAAFGLTGVLLALLGVSGPLSLGVAIFDGALVGGMVTTVLRRATRDTVSGAVDTRQLSGRDAEVVLSVGPGKLGKIRLVHQGQILELPATTREARLLERAERVIVVEVRGGTADVTPLSPERRHPAPTSVTS